MWTAMTIPPEKRPLHMPFTTCETHNPKDEKPAFCSAPPRDKDRYGPTFLCVLHKFPGKLTHTEHTSSCSNAFEQELLLAKAIFVAAGQRHKSPHARSQATGGARTGKNESFYSKGFPNSPSKKLASQLTGCTRSVWPPGYILRGGYPPVQSNLS